MNEYFEFFVPENFRQLSLGFFNAYKIQNEIACPEKRMRGLVPKVNRICRFCNRNNTQVSFKKDAHLISQLLGNKHLVSDFECDNCNQLFSTYETHLANFLGPIRVFQKLYGEGRNYKFKSPSKKTIVEGYYEYGIENGVVIAREDVKDHTFQIDREKGEGIIRLTKHSYSPLLAYKSILKMALACLPHNELKNYNSAFKYLTSNSLDENLKGNAKVLMFSTPPGTGHRSPFAVLFKKKDIKARLITHVFALHFMNVTIQIVIPLNENDLTFYDGNAIDHVFCPPMFADSNTANTINIREQYIDMGSRELIKAEEEVIHIKFDLKDYKKGVQFDPATNEVKKGTFDQNNIMKLVFLPAGSKIKLPVYPNR